MRVAQKTVMRISTVNDDKEWYGKSYRFPYLVVLISIPKELWQTIETIQERLRRIDDRQLYHHPSYLHVTIQQIGWLGEDIREENLSKIRDKIEQVASNTGPFFLSLRGLRLFPDVI